ncbi:MAG: hypothetical protein DMF60_01790 [Acidobacteria bacterium]|nr:MAG: hypothetical protein DMF60_01790 [Acidobacteriota bacterium]
MKTEREERLKRLSPAQRAALLKGLRETAPAEAAARPISKRTQQGRPSLSFAQRRMWFLNQLEPDSPFYNTFAVIRLDGRVDLAVLQQSLNTVVDRHEILRTTFPTENGEPFQQVAPFANLDLPVIDLSSLPETQQELEQRRVSTEESQRTFDLVRGPLIRARVLFLGPQRYLTLISMHHIISDGWSNMVLVEEVAKLYEAFVVGKPSPLADLDIQYADYSDWQREWLQGAELERQLDYWKQQLANMPLLELPTDRPRPAIQTYNGLKHPIVLSNGLTERLKQLSRKEGVTLYMVLLAAFQTLLHRYTNQLHIVVGSPVAGRNHLETERLIGFFANTLAMHIDLSGDPTFAELLERVRKVTLGAYAHQDAPFEKVVEALHPDREQRHMPLLQVMFIMQGRPNTLADGMRIADITLTRLPLLEETGTSKRDLALHLTERAEELAGDFQYNTDLFDAVSIERMAANFEVLLEGIVADPNQRLSNLPVLSAAERRLLVDWNDTALDCHRHACIHELFQHQAGRTPDAVAVIFEELQVTYRVLNQRANQLAHYLRAAGVGPESRVGVCTARSIDTVDAILAILKAGGAFVPLDPTYPKDRCRATGPGSSAWTRMRLLFSNTAKRIRQI